MYIRNPPKLCTLEVGGNKMGRSEADFSQAGMLGVDA